MNEWPQTCRICLPSLTILSGLSLKVVSSFIHLHSQDLSRLHFQLLSVLTADGNKDFF